MARPKAGVEVAIEANMEQIVVRESVVREAAVLQSLAAELYRHADLLARKNLAAIESLRSSNVALEGARRSQVAA
jgi:hypothetical protein